MKKLKKTIRYCVLLFLITTASVVAQPYDNPESNPASTTDGDAAAVPINDYLLVLALVGICIGVAKSNRALVTNKKN